MSDQGTPSRIEHLLSDLPKLHGAGGSLTSRWKLQDADLLYLDQILRPGMRTLETGAGVSTVAFALKGTKHTCVVPDQELVNRIRSFCSDAGIPHADIAFVVDESEHALPRLTGQDYDFALIDGRHGFPAPFIDCYYIARLLKVGGSVMIDDLHIWTVDLLVQYLRSDESWRLVRETWHTATFVKRTDDALTGEWTRQPFVVRRSLRKSLLAKVRLLQRMLRTRDLTPLRRMVGI
jgi:predicted O-methyltransferase YrrM